MKLAGLDFGCLMQDGSDLDPVGRPNFGSTWGPVLESMIPLSLVSFNLNLKVIFHVLKDLLEIE